MQLAVLNPGGNDPEQAFPEGPGRPDDAVAHPPVNYHAYAACTGGTFYRDARRIPAERQSVLVVLRRDLKQCLKAVTHLKQEGKRVAVSLKESGLHQVAKLLGDAGNIGIFREICRVADGCISSTPDLAGIYEAAGGKAVRFIPTPYPVDAGAWDFAQPLAQRGGVFVGTREWETPSRNHAAALLVAGSLGAPVTVVNEDGRAGRKRIEAVGIKGVRVVDGRLPYAEYLRLMARHRIVFQMDRSAVPGQVAGDALLCGSVCVGGDGAIERIAFPGLCGDGANASAIRTRAQQLIRDDGAYAAAASDARRIALERLSFVAVARELGEYYAAL